MMTRHTALKSTKLLKNANYGKSASREIQIRSSIQKRKRRLGRWFTGPNVKQKGKDLETLCSDDQKYKFQFGKKEVPYKIYHEMLLNAVIWYRNSLPQTDTVSLPCLSKDQDMVRESNE